MSKSEPKLIPRNMAIGFSLASMSISALLGFQFHQTISDATVPADRAAWLMHQSANYEAETLTVKPQEQLPESLLLLLGMAVSGGVGVLLWPKAIAPAAFTPAKVQRLQETGLLPYSPTEARGAFVDFFTGMVADYPYLTKMMGSHLIIVNGPSGAKKSRTACCFALMQWIHPDIKRTPYVLDAKADINNDDGTWQGIPQDHIISPSKFAAFWERIQKKKDWCLIVDEIDEWKNAGYGEVLSSIVRVSNTQPRKQRACIIIIAHGDENNGHVELTKDNLGLTDADKGKIAPVRKAANILTLGSYEDDYGKLQPTYQGSWKPGMCDDSQSRKVTIPRSLDPTTFQRYVLPFMESAREPITVSPVVVELEDRLTDRETTSDLIAKFEKAYLQDDDFQLLNLDAIDDVSRSFLQWHFDRYGIQSYEPQPRRAVLTHWTYQGSKLSGEQADHLFNALEQAGIITQSKGDRGKRLYTVQITKEQIQ